MATIDECFNYNSNFDDESVFKCIAQNNFTLLKNVIKMYPESIECLDDYSNTPLLYACYRGSSRIAGYLLARGADYMRINIFGNYIYPTLASHTIQIEHFVHYFLPENRKKVKTLWI